MEESFEELYEQFLKCRKEKIKELIEVQSQISIAEEVSHVRRAQNSLQSHLEATDSDVMGVGKDQLSYINQNQNQTVLPTSQAIDVAQIGMIENVEFED